MTSKGDVRPEGPGRYDVRGVFTTTVRRRDVNDEELSLSSSKRAFLRHLRTAALPPNL